jgi:serine/alanine adding enzyme
MESVVGGIELVDDFYEVFSANMRDLGSPVHSKDLFREVLDSLGDSARIVTVSLKNQCMAGALIVCFRDTIEVPWASSLRRYNTLSPNMLLYWSLLKFASDSGYRYFDFGRSTPGEGTAKFKEQWGAKPHQLSWYTVGCDDGVSARKELQSRSGMSMAEEVWRRLPLFVANLIGPRLRANIPL